MKARDCHHFARVPHAACRIRSKAGLAVYVYLCSVMNADSEVWHSQARISEDMGMPLRTVCRGLTDLASEGWIRKLAAKGRRLGNAYQVLAKSDENFARAKSGTPKSVPTKSGAPKVAEVHAKSGVSYMPKSVPIQEQVPEQVPERDARAPEDPMRPTELLAGIKPYTTAHGGHAATGVYDPTITAICSAWNEHIAMPFGERQVHPRNCGVSLQNVMHVAAQRYSVDELTDAFAWLAETKSDLSWHQLWKTQKGTRVYWFEMACQRDRLLEVMQGKRSRSLPKLSDILAGRAQIHPVGCDADMNASHEDLDTYAAMLLKHWPNTHKEIGLEAQDALRDIPLDRYTDDEAVDRCHGVNSFTQPHAGMQYAIVRAAVLAVVGDVRIGAGMINVRDAKQVMG